MDRKYIPFKASGIARKWRYFKALLFETEFMGMPVWIGKDVALSGKNIKLGDRVTLESGVVLRSSPKNHGINIGRGCHIRSHTVMDVGDGDKGGISIGNDTLINSGCALLGEGEVHIGHHTLIGPNVVITSIEHGFEDPRDYIVNQPCKLKMVRIGSDVYIGAGAIILPGIKIGIGAVIGAGSIVTHDVKAYAVVAGNPARVLRMRIK